MPKVSIKEIINIRAEINEIESKKYKISMNWRAGSLKINKIDKTLTRSTKKREKGPK